MTVTAGATGERLRELRELCGGLSQQELATKLGVSRQVVKNWEHGRSSLHPAMRAAIAQAIGCRLLDLLQPPGTPVKLRRRGMPVVKKRIIKTSGNIVTLNFDADLNRVLRSRRSG
jgi:transcriptional regulator with XRE-family HTH domain